MPIVHQACSIDLLRYKFRTLEKDQFTVGQMIQPDEDEVLAMIYLLLFKNPKFGPIIPYTLHQLLKLEKYQKMILKHRDLIVNNIAHGLLTDLMMFYEKVSA